MIERAGSLLASLGLASLLLLSFTAMAAESTRGKEEVHLAAVPASAEDPSFEPPQLAALAPIMPEPPPSVLPGIIEPPRGLALLRGHIRQVDLAREAADAARASHPLAFLADDTVLPSQPLRTAIAPARAGATPIAIPRPLLTLSRPDGSTPAASRAAALASVTPAPIEPEIVAAASIRLPALARLGPDGRGYLGLLQPEALASEQRCLAEAVYFEARSESEAGQAAVAQVVLNRVKSGLYPPSVCGVVYQNRHRFRACQFTFACEGRSLAIREPAAWEVAERVARRVLEGETYLPAIGHSTHYHAEYVAPRWSRRLNRTDQIGRHIFYRLRPGQT